DVLLDGQVIEEVVQEDVRVGLLPRLAGRLGKVHPANRREEPSDITTAEQLASVLPLVLTALDEVIEGAAAPAGGERELLRHLPGHGGRPASVWAQDHPVVVAVDGVRRVDALTAGTNVVRHAPNVGGEVVVVRWLGGCEGDATAQPPNHLTTTSPPPPIL